MDGNSERKHYKICISAETGTLIFALFNLVMQIISFICGVGLMLFWGIATIKMNREGWDSQKAAIWLGLLIFAILSLFFSLISLLFASFLLNGILKKNPEHIKIYFIYGVVQMVLLALVFIGMSLVLNGMVVPLVIVMFTYIFYSLILSMIRITYLRYEQSDENYARNYS